MRRTIKVPGRRSRGLLLLLLLPGSLHAQPNLVTATATPDRTTIRLSEHLRVTLTIEGPAPLRVELPEPLLAPESAAAWRIRPAGPAKTEPADGGKERWSQTYRLDPYLPGDAVKLAFAPARVTAGTALRPTEPPWVPEIEVKVQTSLAGARADDARPVTTIEELPPVEPVDPGRVGWYVGGATTLLFAAAVLLALRRRWREKARALPPGAWADAELDRLGRERVTGGELAERVAAVLREFVERRHGLPASKLTTTELAAAAERAGWPAESVGVLRGLLERCDRAKFAGEAPDEAESGALLARAREWVNSQSPASGGQFGVPSTEYRVQSTEYRVQSTEDGGQAGSSGS